MKIIKWSGKPISRPGIYSGIPIETYHSAAICNGPAVSSTDLRTAWKKSMAHMFDQWVCNPNREPRAVSDQMILGMVAHHIFLGEDNFNSKFIGQPETYRDLVTAEEKPWHNGAKACKQWNAKQAAKGRTIVPFEQIKAIKGMAASLALEPLVMAGVLNGQIECSLFAKDPETGLWLKGRPDVIPTDSGEYVDLKTAREVTPYALQYAIREYGYQMQGALISIICSELCIPFESFTLMFVETKRPFCVYPAPIDKFDLDMGEQQCRAMIRNITLCIEAGVWPGPFDGHLRPLPIANAERERIIERLTALGIT